MPTEQPYPAGQSNPESPSNPESQSDPENRHPTVLVGIGEMGGVFARAFLRHGSPVFPAGRATDLVELATVVPEPKLVLVTVGEADLHPALTTIPAGWKHHIGLLQNELLPRDWRVHDIVSPTVAAVWFEKKPGQDVKVIIPTPVGGPRAGFVVEALSSMGIEAREVPDEELVFELVRKNLYILTMNIAGLVTGGTVTDVWDEHNQLARDIAAEVLALQAWLTGQQLDSAALIAGMVEAIEGDPDHGATGRSAPSRLARALGHAAESGIPVPTLEGIQRGLG